MKILITAFEPFGKEKENSSKKLLENLRNFQDIDKIVLPVVFGKCYEKVYKEMENRHYDYIIMTGESCGRTSISVERIAVNVNDSHMADNDGNKFNEEKIFPNGADGYFTGINIKAVQNAFESEKIPISISNSAGTYVCNNLFYGVLHKIRTERLPTRAGFFHIPCLTEQTVKKPDLPSISINTAIKGMETILTLAIGGEL